MIIEDDELADTEAKAEAVTSADIESGGPERDTIQRKTLPLS
jgi:hypothetical protein